jgi:hypothetical protein
MRAGRRRRLRRALAATVVVAGLGIGLVGARHRNGSPKRTAQQTVDEFFAAQKERDCGRLINVLADMSWSDQGRRTRAEFLAQCEDALEGFEPVDAPGGYFADDEDGDRVTVESPAGVHDGTLLREDGEWQVVTDPDVLTIGRTPEDTVRGYVAAYDAGDCDTMLDHLSAEVEPGPYLEDCAAEAEVRAESDEPATEILRLAVSEEDGNVATASVAFDDNALDGDDVVTLRREGLEWVLDENQTRPPRRPGPPLVQEHYVALRARLLDQIETIAGCGRPTDRAVDGESHGEPGALRAFIACHVVLELREVESRVEAGMLAQALAAQVAGSPLPTVEALAAARRRNRVPEAAPGELEAYVASLRPNQWATVPGSPNALGVRTSCTAEGCAGTVATLPFGTYVLQVRLADVADLGVAAALLNLQTERL